ncbi:MAG: BrnT family toxin [Deltaproteobacteria bacterium]|nr:BrnT family toxin [Deltaproteobacteria bacterium]
MDDPRLVLAEDAAHGRSESRYFAFGRVGGGILTVRFAVRGERVRFIGAGYWRKGKAFYEQANRV